MKRLALSLVLLSLCVSTGHAEEPLSREDLTFLVGEFEGRGEHPYGTYDETITAAWALGETTVELRSKSTMGGSTVFEDLRVLTFDATTKTLRMRQFTAGLVRDFAGARDDDGRLVFTETAREGAAPDTWRYTFTPADAGGFAYRVDTRRGEGEWTRYVSGTLTPAIQDPSKGGGLGMRAYTATIDGLRAEVHHPDGEGPFPAIVFSPGGNAATTNGYAPYGRWYATWGFITVVVAFDDADAAARAPKFGAIADWLVAENARDGSPLEGLVATERLAAAGHSRGGAAALRAARADPRFIACLALAPSGPMEAVEGEGAAITCIVAAEKDDLLPAAKAAFAATPGERVLVEVAGLTHMLTPRESTLKLVERSTSFLNLALKGDARYRLLLTEDGPGVTVTTAR